MGPVLELGPEDDAFKEVEGDVVHGPGFEVEVDEDSALLGVLKEGKDAALEAVDAADGVDGVEVRVHGGDLDGDVRAREGAEVVRLHPRVGGPGGDLRGEVIDEIEISSLIVFPLGVGGGGLAEHTHREGHPLFPKGLELRQRLPGVGAEDELAGHQGDVLPHRPRGDGGGEAAGGGLDGRAQERRDVAAFLQKIFADVRGHLAGHFPMEPLAETENLPVQLVGGNAQTSHERHPSCLCSGPLAGRSGYRPKPLVGSHRTRTRRDSQAIFCRVRALPSGGRASEKGEK